MRLLGVQKLFLALMLAMSVAPGYSEVNPIQTQTPEVTQAAGAAFRLFPMRGGYLKLDTRNGKVWLVQWGEQACKTSVLNGDFLSLTQTPGRFTLHQETAGRFFLLDQEDGRMWKVQWSQDPVTRMVITSVAGEE